MVSQGTIAAFPLGALAPQCRHTQPLISCGGPAHKGTASEAIRQCSGGTCSSVQLSFVLQAA